MTVVTTVLHPENDPTVDLHPETDAGQVIDFLNKTYPVGAVYMSLQSTSPASLFGGTWTAITAGFLVSAGYSEITAGSVGGRDNITLSQDNLPRRAVIVDSNRSGVAFSGYDIIDTPSPKTANPGSSVFSTVNTFVNNLNSFTYYKYEQPINILPSYYGVYMWRRVA